MNQDRPRVSIRLPVALPHLPALRTFLEESARAFGFPPQDGFRMALAGEEIFSHLCSLDAEGGRIEVEIERGGPQLRADFLFRGEHFDPWAFNIGARITLEDEASLDGLGLLMASRAVDHFSIHPRSDGRVGVRLVKEKTYPPTPPAAPFSSVSSGRCLVQNACDETIRRFVARLRTAGPAGGTPGFLDSAGRVIDMVESGEYGMVVAVDERQEVVGGALWHPLSERTTECFGPYLVGTEEGAVAQDLLDTLIGRIAKTHAVCLICRWAGPALPRGAFELLGRLAGPTATGTGRETPVLCRFLKEDLGCRVWTTPELAPYLEEQYERLSLPRTLDTARDEGENRSPHSVFSTRIDRERGEATIRPVLAGLDEEENLGRHVSALSAEGITDIRFELDLASARQALLAPALRRGGFAPRLVMPYAGLGDIVVWQKESER